MTPINLTQEEMDHIRAEELFRANVRKEIELERVPQKWANRYWEFINSNFGLWILSTIFISVIGTFYTNYQNAEKERQQKNEVDRVELQKKLDRIDRISMEMSYRISTAMIRLEAAAKMIKEKPDENVFKLRINALTPLSRPTSDKLPPLFPEFKNYSGSVVSG